MFFYGDRILSAAFDRRVVDDDHAVAPRDTADAGDDSACGQGIVVESKTGKGRELKEFGAAIEQRLDADARQHFAAAGVAFPRGLIAAEPDFDNTLTQIADKS